MQVFLDLDGPLLDVVRRYYLIYSDLLEESGYQPFDRESYWSLKRLSINESAIIQRSAATIDTTEYLERRLQLLEDPAYLLYDSLQKGVVKTLSTWAGEHSLFLVTLRRSRSALVSQLELLGIESYFDAVFCAEGVEPSWKTKCEWIRSCRTRADQSVIIGDTEVDVLAGRAAGVNTVALSCGIRSRRLLEQLAPDFLLPGLVDVDLLSLGCAGYERTSTGTGV